MYIIIWDILEGNVKELNNKVNFYKLEKYKYYFYWWNFMFVLYICFEINLYGSLNIVFWL